MGYGFINGMFSICEFSIFWSNINTTKSRGTKNTQYAQFIQDNETEWVCASFHTCIGTTNIRIRGEVPSEGQVWDSNAAAEGSYIMKAVMDRNVMLVK